MQHFNTTPLGEMQSGEMQFGEMQLSHFNYLSVYKINLFLIFLDSTNNHFHIFFFIL